MSRSLNGKVILDRVNELQPGRYKGFEQFCFIGFPGCAALLSLYMGHPRSVSEMAPTRGSGELFALGSLRNLRQDILDLSNMEAFQPIKDNIGVLENAACDVDKIIGHLRGLQKKLYCDINEAA